MFLRMLEVLKVVLEMVMRKKGKRQIVFSRSDVPLGSRLACHLGGMSMRVDN